MSHEHNLTWSINLADPSPKPMQTHGLTEEVWYPPIGVRWLRFVTYDARDESWMRPLGLGRIVKVAAPWFDVRDEENRLVGYVNHNPCAVHPECPKPLRIISPKTGKCVSVDFWATDWGIQNGSTRVAVRSWRVASEDASLVVLAGFVKLLGSDNFHAWVHELERRVMQREQSLRWSTVSRMVHVA